MIITIQQVNDRTVIRFGTLEITTNVLSLATTIASGLADAHWEKTGERIDIKLLPIQHTPVMRVSPGFVEKMDNIINSNLLMKKTKKANKLKKAVTAKAKKALKAKKK